MQTMYAFRSMLIVKIFFTLILVGLMCVTVVAHYLITELQLLAIRDVSHRCHFLCEFRQILFYFLFKFSFNPSNNALFSTSKCFQLTALLKIKISASPSSTLHMLFPALKSSYFSKGFSGFNIAIKYYLVFHPSASIFRIECAKASIKTHSSVHIYLPSVSSFRLKYEVVAVFCSQIHMCFKDFHTSLQRIFIFECGSIRCKTNIDTWCL